MTLSPPASTAASRNAGPSLFKLISHVPTERRLRHPPDALVILGRQLELIVQEEGVPADLAIGTLRFSLFRLHQGRIAQLAPYCRSITVYGEADVETPAMPGVEFVPLPPASPLCQEWFLVIDSADFWGALLTRAVPDRSSGTMRRYLFEGALTADERVVSRANLLLSLTQRRPAPDVGPRNAFANRARWARVAHGIASHSEAERLNLIVGLSELPEFADILANPGLQVEQLLPQALGALTRHSAAAGALIYRYEGQQLRPVAWNSLQTPPLIAAGEGICGQALTQIEPVLAALHPGDLEQNLLPEAQSAVAVPMMVHGQPWGVLLVGQPEADPAESPTALGVIGVAALLDQLLDMRLPAAAAPVHTLAPPPTESRLVPPAFLNGGSELPGAPVSPEPRFVPPPPAAGPFLAPQFDNPAASSPLPINVVPPASPPFASPAPVSPAPASAPPISPAPAPPVAVPGTAPSAFGLPAWMRGAAAAPPPAANTALPTATSLSAPAEVQRDRSWAMLQKRLMGALIAFDQRAAEQVWNEACSLYATEAICTELLVPVQVAVGEGWHRGEVSVAAEHFCSRFVEGKLLNLLNAYVDNPSGPLAVIGCAQAELHELGAIMLSLFMRWSGFRVIYLGQNIPNSTIEETVCQLRPQVLGLSATTIEAAHNLTEVGQIIARIEPPRPLFIFGGMAFYERPDLRSRIHGQFLEGDIRKIVRDLAEQLRRG